MTDSIRLAIIVPTLPWEERGSSHDWLPGSPQVSRAALERHVARFGDGQVRETAEQEGIKW